MKILRILLYFALLPLFSACSITKKGGSRRHLSKVERSERLGLTVERYVALKKYLKYRRTLSDRLSIPSESSTETLRVRIAQELNLSTESDWETLLDHKIISECFTDTRRKKFLGLS